MSKDADVESNVSEISSNFLEESKRSTRTVTNNTLNWATDLNISEHRRLHPVQAVNIAVVLEELSDKLTVIGKGLNAPLVELRTTSSIKFDKLHLPQLNITRKSNNAILDDQWLIKQRYDTVLPRRINQINRQVRVNSLSQTVQDFQQHLYTVHGKLELSRAFAQNTINKTVAELMQVEIKNVKLDVVAEATRFKMALWSLQDSLQEHNIRCDMENKYTIHTCDMVRDKSKKYCLVQENLVLDELVSLRHKHTLEYSVHDSMIRIITKMKSDAEIKLEYWLEKYETDKEALTRSLEKLKAERAQCLDRIEWIHNTTANYKPIVRDDRRVKKIEANRLARLELTRVKATIIQAWWRGTLVRKCLGPFSAKNMTIKNMKQATGGGKKKKK